MSKPKCDKPDQCRVTPTATSTVTLAYYPPVYDGHGNNLNPDRNKRQMLMKCYTCGKEWVDER